MGKRKAIEYKKMALRIVGPRDEYLAARVQRVDMRANIPTTDIDELGNPEHAGSTRDAPDISATIQAMDTSVKLFSVLTGTDPNNYPTSGVSINKLNDVDLILVVRDESVADYVKSVHVNKAHVNGFTFTYSVDGEATEEYTFTATNRRLFKYDIIVDTFTSANSSPLSLSETPLQLKNGNYIISYIQDGRYFTEVTSSPTAGEDEYRYNAGTIILADPISDYAVAVYHANTGSNLWSDVSDSTIPAALRGRDVDVYIAANDIPRVQSVTLRGTFPIETIREMGNAELVGTISQVPQITGDITVLDTDLDLVALFSTGNINSTEREFEICEYTASGISLEIRLLDPSDPCNYSGGSVLKTIYVPSIEITSEGRTINVGGLAQETFSFKSTTGNLYIYSGSR